MAWYVFALVDAMPSGRAGKGLTGPLSIRTLSSGFAVVERRADVPPVAFGSLKAHQDVVARLATRVPAILPVRFGTLLESDSLEEALQERDEEIAAAFDLVRGRVQFTWRRQDPKRETRGATRGARAASADPRPRSGADYLRRAAKAAHPAPPAAWRLLRVKLAPLVAGERYQPRTDKIPESLYQLVERTAAISYATVGAALPHANPTLTMTGPWPPFAFAPEIL